MTAVAALRDATRAGVSLRLVAGKAKVSGDVAPELLARLREHKAEIVEILSADRCCQCGEPLAWPGPVGIVLGDDNNSYLAGWLGKDPRALHPARPTSSAISLRRPRRPASVDVGLLRRWREITNRHVVDQPPTQRSHPSHLTRSCLRIGLDTRHPPRQKTPPLPPAHLAAAAASFNPQCNDRGRDADDCGSLQVVSGGASVLPGVLSAPGARAL